MQTSPLNLFDDFTYFDPRADIDFSRRKPASATPPSLDAERSLAPACHPACESGVAPKLATALQDASRTRERWSLQERASVLECGDRDAWRKPASATPFSPADHEVNDPWRILHAQVSSVCKWIRLNDA
ncbi:hypothetical protein [Prosthecobacter sp.]|uniref:hypothetical protein n=1 Tax=Prosthecobacter sp. TaxID=1965333 RepID=UPI0024899CB3|nr:hypothetical protein [Prosthecobacter sp.]MDI1311612.1 hypothetical protein [Prosthecobacter sp.]